MQSVVAHYEEVLREYRETTKSGGDDVKGIPQQCSLQLLFNLNFLSSVLLVQEVSVINGEPLTELHTYCMYITYCMCITYIQYVKHLTSQEG